MNKSCRIKGNFGQSSYSHKCQDQPSMFSPGCHELSMRKQYVTGRANLSAPYLLTLTSPHQTLHPPIFTLRLYFTTLCFRFTVFLMLYWSIIPSSPMSTLNPVAFTFTSETTLLNAALAFIRERRRQAEMAGYKKSREEGLRGCHFDVQGMSVFPLFNSLWLFFNLQVQMIVPSINSHAAPLIPFPSGQRLLISLRGGCRRIISRWEEKEKDPTGFSFHLQTATPASLPPDTSPPSPLQYH